ncbi:MAG: cob(I)yrinic acid a,c-diamide adenosyltransferase [Planctomycetaceae bacterium]
MVHLNRIYTKSGDAGQTSLGTGTRVPKTSARIAAYGAVDELNSLLGVAIANGLDNETSMRLRTIQNDLFDLGADLCVPETDQTEETSSTTPPPLRVTVEQVDTLESWIDNVNEKLEPLSSFILPGGTIASAQLHLARAVCRRVEIAVLRLVEEEPINSQVAIYLNRLSDLLFVLARAANENGQSDILWVPGKHRERQSE